MYCFVNNIKMKKSKKQKISTKEWTLGQSIFQAITERKTSANIAPWGRLQPLFTLVGRQTYGKIIQYRNEILKRKILYVPPCIMIPIHFQHFRRRVCEYPVMPEIGYAMGQNFLCFTTFIKGAFEKKGKRASFKKDQQLFSSKTSENCEKNFLSQVPPRY